MGFVLQFYDSDAGATFSLQMKNETEYLRARTFLEKNGSKADMEPRTEAAAATEQVLYLTDRERFKAFREFMAAKPK